MPVFVDFNLIAVRIPCKFQAKEWLDLICVAKRLLWVLCGESLEVGETRSREKSGLLELPL